MRWVINYKAAGYKYEEATGMSKVKLADRTCAPCNGHAQPLDAITMETLLSELATHWQLSADKKSISRRYTFKGFAKAVYLSNLCVWLADEQGHHPDIAFGWGYCHVSLTTHDIDALTENDFIWAANLDKLTD